MKYGLVMASAGVAGDARTMGELAHIAEESGWDGVFLEDYIVWQGHADVPTYDPWITLAVMALRTQRVRLGTTVTPIPRRRPWKLAQELVTLDHLSNGRMILGVGLGDLSTSPGLVSSFTNFREKVEIKTRAQLLDEGLEVITRIWRGELFSYAGDSYKIKDVQVLPHPLQKPRIPIWVGGGYPNPGPLKRALRWDGTCMYKQDGQLMQPEDIRALRELVIEQRGTMDGYDISIGGEPRWKNEGKQKDYLESVAAEGVTWWHEYIPPDVGGYDVKVKKIMRGPLRIQ